MEPAVHRGPLSGIGSLRAEGHAAGDAVARDAAGPGLYVHVPFCATRCTYCDFSSGTLTSAAVERYLLGMEREAALRAPEAAGLEFRTVFFGGGTPSALSSRHFARLDRALHGSFRIAAGAEITLEANPESVRPALLETWRACGVNRLSMGAQSAHAAELTCLGRIHSPGRPAEAVAMAREHGFRRLSLDLMFAFPGHARERWAETLDWVLSIDPGHLSAYCFIPEPGTPLGDAVLRGAAQTPPDEAQADLYGELADRCGRAGYACYETSNFARPGEAARHNLGYWLRRAYVGLGPSAHGFLGGERYGNHYALGRWASALERDERPEAAREVVAGEEVAREMVLLGLRLGEGMRRADYAGEDWTRLEARYGAALRHAAATGRIERTASGWRIPAPLRFLADDVIAWIDARADLRGATTRRNGTAEPCRTPPDATGRCGLGLTVSGGAP